jgi:hypothetical protein
LPIKAELGNGSSVCELKTYCLSSTEAALTPARPPDSLQDRWDAPTAMVAPSSKVGTGRGRLAIRLIEFPVHRRRLSLVFWLLTAK